jgi:DNA repair protein RecN (Recombination protein N)
LLVSLSIKNYALIEEASLNFKDGFTVITGETGAGKSILLGALGLITGKRADSTSAGDQSLKCIIEGVFKIDSYHLKDFFDGNDLDYEASTIIRREIVPSGKSRAFINDTPVTLQQLQFLGERLVDIHSQHKTLEVLDTTYQFDIVDTFANTQKLLSAYQDQYALWKKSIAELEEIQNLKKKAQLEYDYQSFLFKELEEASLVEGEFEKLEGALNQLSHAEEIQEGLVEAQQMLSQDQIGVLEMLTAIRTSLSKLVNYGADYEDLYNRVKSSFLELEDVTQELETKIASIQTDPKELQRVNERVQQLYNLMQKHQVQEVTELIKIREELDATLFEVQNVDGKIAVLEKEIAFAKASLEKTAATISSKREESLPSLIASIEKILNALGMPNARLKIELVPTKELTLKGWDTLQFLFSANKGMEPKSLKKGASGGELSRVMLAVKAVLSRHKKLPTLIFDEIDTGVSGDIALKMGDILKNMGNTMQLMSITHLPQIAGQGTSHFKVFKEDNEAKTATQIIELSQEDRIIEIAEMLGGVQGSTTALEHAKNLLN